MKRNEEFLAAVEAHVAAGLPAGQCPDLTNHPDRAMALSGWTLGYPRIDSMTGEELMFGQPSLIEKQRRQAEFLKENKDD